MTARRFSRLWIREMKSKEKISCALCPRACRLAEGESGFCRARLNQGGRVRLKEPGLLSSLALDPIEKKPLAYFRPGEMILSAGFFGCNMRCPFCQNYHISMEAPDPRCGEVYEPEKLLKLASALRPQGNCGIAFTYNEPILAYEYIMEVFRLARAEGLETVLVTNGNFMPEPIERLAPWVTAWNIDLKCFSEEGYERLGGSFDCVKKTIAIAARHSHVEVTTLLVPGLNDSEEEMEKEAAWLASLDPEIPLHITRYFPLYKDKGTEPTPRRLMETLEKTARKHLKYVRLGNV